MSDVKVALQELHREHLLLLSNISDCQKELDYQKKQAAEVGELIAKLEGECG